MYSKGYPGFESLSLRHNSFNFNKLQLADRVRTPLALHYWITSLTTSLFASRIGSAIALPYTFIVVLMSAWRIRSFCTVMGAFVWSSQER